MAPKEGPFKGLRSLEGPLKAGMTNVDVAALAAELHPLLRGARLEKAYQPEKNQILLRFRRKGVGRLDLLFELGRYLTLIRQPAQNPDKPSMVAQILRTSLENARVLGFQQVGFDRLLRMDLERGDGKRSLIFEMFGDGNLLLLGDDEVILLPMIGGDFGARKVRKGQVYQPPPGGTDPLNMDLAALKARGAVAGKDLVRMLAVEVGFGPLWAEELCLRSNVPKNSKPSAMDEAAWQSLHQAIEKLRDEVRRNDLAPAIVLEDGQPVDAVPFVMLKFPSPKFVHEECESFRIALDKFFVGTDEEDVDDPRRHRMAEAQGKIQRQLDQMNEALDTYAAEEEVERAAGDAIYASYPIVDSLLTSLNAARKDRPWTAVSAILDEARAKGDANALRVPVLRPHEGTAVFAIHDAAQKPVNVEVDLRITVADNADLHYAAAKKAKSRQAGAIKARDEAMRRMDQLEAKGLDGFGAAPKRSDEQSRHFWFENYRWTLTPSGRLAVGGRSAAQNDAVVKKYLRAGDRYVHADVHGAPSVVVRDVDKVEELTDEDMATAGQFAVCSSRAWRQFGQATAYWVTPEQVNKTPRSGEFVPRGAWIIHGKRNHLPNFPMQWWIAKVAMAPTGRPAAEGDRVIEKIVGGPPSGLRPWASMHIEIFPGEMDTNDAAPILADRLGCSVEEVQSALPPGGVRFEGSA